MLHFLIGLIIGPSVTTLATFFVHFICYVLVTCKGEMVQKLNQILKSSKMIGPRDANGDIAHGWHLGWYNRCLIIVHKDVEYTERATRYTYTIYTPWVKAYVELCTKLTADDQKVVTVYEESLSPWRTSDIAYNDCRILSPYTRQEEIMYDMMERYEMTECVLYFISGEARLGKTTLGELFGRMLIRKTKMNVTKVPINLAAPGKCVLDYFHAQTIDTILILELNEYEIAIKTATGEIKYESREVSCHAASKTSLNDLVDFFSRQKRLVVIATTNDKELFNQEKYKPFIERFDKAIQY